MDSFSSVEPDIVGGLAGGALIGLSASLMLLGLGRIAGVSGIAAQSVGLGHGALPRASGWLFLLGLPLGAFLVHVAHGAPPVRVASTPVLIVAGLLVGFGSRLGSGCTSGHGVCGVSRLSVRSVVATALFMAAGMFAVILTRQLGFRP